MQFTNEKDLYNTVLNAPIGICILDADTLVSEIVNDKFLEVAGKPREAIAGKFYWDSFAEARVYYESALSGVVETGEPYYADEVELMLIRHGKEEMIFVTFVYSPIKNNEGKVTKVAVWVLENTRQVVERQKVETAKEVLQKERDQLSRFFMQAPAGICVLSGPELVYELVNPAYQQLLPNRKLLGRPIFEALPELVDQPLHDVLLNVYRTGEDYDVDELLIPVAEYEGGPTTARFFTFNYSARRDEADKIDGILVFVFEVTEQVSARKTAERAEERLRMAIDAAELGSYYINTTDRIFHPSPRLKEFFGFHQDEEVPYEAAINQIHEDYRQAAADLVELAITTGIRFDMEYPVVGRHDGKIRWVRGLGTVQHYDGKSFFTGVLHDITERKLADQLQAQNAEEMAATNEEMAAVNEELSAANEEMAATNEEMAAVNEELATTNQELTETQVNLRRMNADLLESESRLRRSERLFRSIAVNIPRSLIMVIGKDHRYIAVEGEIMEKMGFNGRDYEGKHPTEVMPPERYEASRLLYERVLAGETFVVERKTENGEDFMVHFVPLVNDLKEVYAGLIIALDITDIKQAEEKSAKLAAIIESSDDAIISKTLESVITSWNDSAQRMFGYTAEEIIGETIYKLIPPDRQDEEPRIISRLKTGERVEHFETQRMTKDGLLLDVSLSISPVKDKQGNIIGVSKIVRDITERKLDENRKNDFIGMVSHELKTPLTSLTAIIQVLGARLKNSGDAFVPGALEKAALQVKRMSNMINGFLNISRLESGKILVEKQRFDIDQLLQEMIEEAQLTATTHQIEFTGCGELEINADRDKISSVISNLINNAIKYSPRGKRVAVRCETIGETVTVSIRDEGIGIAPDDMEKVFDRYYRVVTDYNQHISGFGIGLYLSAEIIKRHDGRIWLESEPGVGSTFYFALPLAG